MAATITWWFPLLFGFTLAIAVFLIGMIAWGFYADRTMAATVLAASVQVAFGMVIGFVCVYIGLMMTWFGIDASYAIKAGVGTGDVKAEGTLNSASPGLLFALSGIVLIAVSLHKNIEYQENASNLVDTQSLDPGSSESGVTPKAPSKIRRTPTDLGPDPNSGEEP
jgi:hypothetical protein